MQPACLCQNVLSRTLCLPFVRQLVPANGTAIQIVNLAEKHDIFVWVGGVASISLMLVGLLALTSVMDTITIVRAINLASGAAAVCAVGDT